MEEQHKLFTYVRKYGWYAICFFMVATASLFYIQKRNHSLRLTTKQDYLTALDFTSHLHSDKNAPQESLDAMEKLLSSHPEIAPSFDGALSLAFLAEENHEKGVLYAKKSLSRTISLLTEPVVNFSSVSLLIEEGKFSEATSASIALEERLSKEINYPYLRAFNLLRLHFLTKDERYLVTLKTLPQYSQIKPLFQSGELSLDSAEIMD